MTSSALAWIAAGVGLLALWGIARALRAPGLLRKLRGLALAAAAAGLGLLLAALILVTHLFQAFARDTLVARVTTRPLAAGAFELTYTPLAPEGPPVRVELRGDQWTVSGGIVKWHPWLTALGLKSYHRPTRLSGQFADLRRQQAEPPSVQALDAGADAVWEGLYRAAPLLPIIDAAYGSAASAYVDAKTRYEVFVSLTGYLIRRRPLGQEVDAPSGFQ